MKIVHTADIHLGFRAYERILKGFNARELDIYNTWLVLLKRVEEIKPDLVIIAGDLFNANRPSNLAKSVSDDLWNLSVPVLLIPGNHDSGTLYDVPPITPLKKFSNITVVLEQKVVSFSDHSFFCVPWTTRKIDFQRADFLVGHLSVKGPREFPDGIQVPAYYQHCFLGHLHYPYVRGNYCYAGSIERLTFNTEKEECGFFVWEDGQNTFHKLPARHLITLVDPNPEDASKYKGAIVRIQKSLENDFSTFHDEAFHVKEETIGLLPQKELTSSLQGTFVEQFVSFAKTSNCPNSIIQKGKELLERAIASTVS
jgi:DNA repair exonuclease SbcCD nuclease subunit